MSAPRQSSFGKGFGLGCGLVFGILAAIVALFIVVCGGFLEVGSRVADEAMKRDTPNGPSGGRGKPPEHTQSPAEQAHKEGVERGKKKAESKTAREAAIRSAIRIDAGELMARYRANEVAADLAYKGKLLEVRGVVETVGIDLLNTRYVALKTGNAFDVFCIQCFFDSDWNEALALVKPEYIYRIRGRCEGKFGNVVMKHCDFVSREEEEQAARRIKEEAQRQAEEATRKKDQEANTSLLHQARQALADAKSSISENQYGKALTSLQKAIQGFQWVAKSETQVELAKEAAKELPEAERLHQFAKVEEDAASALRVAMILKENNRPEAARGRLEKVIKDYPNTHAASEAKRALGNLKQRK